MITLGILVAAAADIPLVGHEDGWRYAIFLQAERVCFDSTARGPNAAFLTRGRSQSLRLADSVFFLFFWLVDPCTSRGDVRPQELWSLMALMVTYQIRVVQRNHPKMSDPDSGNPGLVLGLEPLDLASNGKPPHQTNRHANIGV